MASLATKSICNALGISLAETKSVVIRMDAVDVPTVEIVRYQHEIGGRLSKVLSRYELVEKKEPV